MMMKTGLALALAGIVCLACMVGAAWIATRLIRSNRVSVLAAVPVRTEQTVAIGSEGEVVVSVEVPRLTTDFRSWELEVEEKTGGRVHTMKWGGPRSTGAVSGISTVRIPFGRITLARPDQLGVRIKGLNTGGDLTTSQVVFTRPYLARMALQIVGLVVCGVGILLSLIWALWMLGVVKSS